VSEGYGCDGRARRQEKFMSKMIWIGCVTALSASSTLAGCETSGEPTGSKSTTTSGGLEPGEAEDACYSAYEACFDATGDAIACKERYTVCVGSTTTTSDEPPPPAPVGDAVAQCHDGFKLCLDAGEDIEVCRAKLESCLGVVFPEPGSDPSAGVPPAEYCMRYWEECRQAGGDELACKERYNACVGNSYPTPPPEPPPADDPFVMCKLAFEACLGSGEQPEKCEGELNRCIQAAVPPAQPSPESACLRVYDECLVQHGDEVACKERYIGCLDSWSPPAEPGGPGDPGDPGQPGEDPKEQCRQAFEGCLADANTPEACEDKLRYCIEAVPTPTDPGTPDDGYPGGPCRAGLDSCLRFATNDGLVTACKVGFEACLQASPESFGAN